MATLDDFWAFLGIKSVTENHEPMLIGRVILSLELPGFPIFSQRQAAAFRCC